MTKDEVMNELAVMGNSTTKKTFMRHGAKEPIFGVKVGDLKKLVKKIKKNHELSLELFQTGNSDAMYLAGLIADEQKITKNQLREWVEKAQWYMISEYTVAWIAAESKFGWELGLEWIESAEDKIASAGWSTLASWISIKPDSDLLLPKLKELLKRIEHSLKKAQNRERYTMNGFVISVGSYVKSLWNEAMDTAIKIGKVDVYMGETSCKVPLASDYIKKIKDMDRVGHKRKMARC